MRINDAKTWDPITSELNALESALQQEQTLCPAKRENLQSLETLSLTKFCLPLRGG